MENKTDEIWVEVSGWPNYEVSNLGRVRNIKTGKILKQYPQNSGYVYVWMERGSGRCANPLHRVVAESFYPVKEWKDVVDHIDTNRSNNVLSNLRWATYKENSNNETTKKNRKKKKVL